jgi:hypothetical protein
MGESAPIAFIHLPRTAGSSLTTALVRRFGADVARVKSAGPVSQEDAEAIPDGARIICGHMNYGLHQHRPVRYATVLRDPVQRYLSQFRLNRIQRQREGLADMPLREFAGRLKFHNLQTSMLAGTHLLTNGSLFDAHLAQRHLERFAFVGFFDELGAFTAAMGAEDLPHVNRTEDPLELDEETLELVRQANRIDIGLYAWARERFSETRPIGLEGPGRVVRARMAREASGPPPIAVICLYGAAPGLDWPIAIAHGARAFPLSTEAEVPAAIAGLVEDDTALFHGEMNHGLHQFMPVRYAALLREPIDWALRQLGVSVSAAPQHIREQRLERDLSAPLRRNRMTRRLAGTYRVAEETPEDLELAKRHLETFFAVGFHSELEAFARAIGIGPPRPAPEPDPIQLTPEQLERLRAANAMDIALYAWARERFGQAPAALAVPA